MPTSLAQQLKSLAAPQTSILDHKQKKVSILYSTVEAAQYSRDVYFEIGLAGFKELSEVNNKFLKFQDLLFGTKSKDFQRMIQSKEMNEKLDKNIEEFLLLLSPYLQKQASLKALEWLVQRFNIHSMNANSLMMCILPYYETVLFIRILQILDIRDPLNPWHWLNRSQIKGRPVPKDTIFLHWASNHWFRNFLSKYFRKVLRVANDDLHLKVASSLLFTTQIGGLTSAQKVTEDHLSSICQTLQRCLQSKNKDVLSGSLMMVSHLVFATNLSEGLLQDIIGKILQLPDSSLSEHCCVSLLNIFYHQDLASVSLEAVKALDSNSTPLSHLLKIAEKKSVAAFVIPYTKALIKFVLVNEKLSEGKQVIRLKNLAEYLGEIPLTPHDASLIIRSYIRGLADCNDSLMKFKVPFDIPFVLKKLEASHPEGFDLASADILRESTISVAETIDLEAKAIKDFRKRYIISSCNFGKTEASKTSRRASKLLSWEERWLELKKVSKLTNFTKTFLDKVFSSIDFCRHRNEQLPFWTVGEDQDEFYTSVKITVRLLNIVIMHLASKTNSDTCDLILRQIFKEKLESTKDKLRFLSMLWAWENGVGHKGEIDVSENLKVWALRLTSALLKSPDCSTSGGSLAWVVDGDEVFVPSLFIPICEGGESGRSAFEVLEAMLLIMGAGLRVNSLSPLVQKIVDNKEEITSDPSFLPCTISYFVKKRNQGTKMLELLFSSVIINTSVPLHIKSAVLYAISQVQSVDILTQLIPMGNSLFNEIDNLKGNEMLSPSRSSCLYYILLRFSDDASFVNVPGGWELFQRALVSSSSVLNVAEEILSPQELVANYKLLRAVSSTPLLLEVLDGLITRVVETKNTKEASKLKKELKKISLCSSQIICLLDKYELIPKITSIREARAKKLKLQKDGAQNQCSDNWFKLELVVELVGVMPDLKEPWLLVGPFCDHLQALMEVDAPFSDLLQQQMLSVCLHLLETSSRVLSDDEFPRKCLLNVALIVQTIRTSVNPDIHRRALMILSLASKYFSDQVLHNIMAIFTFMGTSLLRRDDSYSFQVIHSTITSIVPTLIQAKSSDREELVGKLSRVTQVFVDALPDLAEHRRMPLFTQLALTLGVSQYLWLVMVLIADAYVSHGIAKHTARVTSRSTLQAISKATPDQDSEDVESDPRRLPSNIYFALILYSQFSVIDQLKASCEVLNFVVNLPNSTDEIGVSRTGNLSLSVIDVKTRSSRQLRQLKYSCLGLLVHLISSEKFVRQVYEFTKEDKSPSELTDLKELYRVLLERSLDFLKVVTNLEKSLKGHPNGRFWNAMQRKLMDLVDAVNSLLPAPLLIEIVSKLIKSRIGEIRCRAMEILASKLQPEAKFFDDEELEDVSQFIRPLREIGLDATQNENIRQTAFFTLQLLVRKLNGKVEPELVLPILESTAKLINAGDASVRVVTQASLVVAESISVLKVQAVEYLHALVPTYLSILRGAISEDETTSQDNLVIASAMAIHRIVEHLPRLVAKAQLMELLELCCRLISKQGESAVGEESHESRLTARLTSVLEHLIKSVELRILIPSLIQTYSNMSSVCPSSLPSLMKVIESLIKSIKVQDLMFYKQQFINLFVGALDIRSSNSKSGVINEVVEGHVISSLTRFQLKLDEDDNIMMILKLQNWAAGADADPCRLTTYFRFTSELASCLKVLFIKARLAEKVFDFSVQILLANNNSLQKDNVFGSGEEAETKANELLQYVLDTLSKIFLYDTVQFITEERFADVVEPLLGQIENTMGTDEEFRERISNHLKPCIIKFTKALLDDSLWKDVNRRVLQRVRTDNDSKIILAGLEIFEGLMDVLGEEYLQSVLSDTVPCITEVLESFDTDVEMKTKQIYLKMEALVGDSLKVYLDS